MALRQVRAYHSAMALTPQMGAAPIGEAAPPPTAFEVRFDALVSRMQRLARVAGAGTIGAELRDVTDEMVRIRRDMANLDPTAHVTAPAAPSLEPEHRPYRTRGTATRVASDKPGARNGQARQGKQLIAGCYVTIPKGKRYCAGHNDGEGAMLSEKDFKVKNPRTGQLTSWCTACTRKYQQDRYVRVGYKRVTVQVQEGDSIVGHDCRLCGFPFEIGERVQGENVAHESCLDASSEGAKPAVR